MATKAKKTKSEELDPKAARLEALAQAMAASKRHMAVALS